MKNISKNIILVVAGFLIGSCQKELPNQPKPNQLPSTRLYIVSDSTLLESSSRQHLYWYGEDPDGIVVGYLITSGNYRLHGTLPYPDTSTYYWTTRTDSIISLPLLTKRDSFTVIIRSVDNTFDPKQLSQNAQIRLIPQPYWDKNTNGIFDSVDVTLSSLSNSIDPKGSIQLLPLRNTPPNVFFSVNTLDSSTVQQPETTFTVATFSWYGTDIDGDQTIASYRLALNDTSTSDRWLTVNNTVTFVTLIVPRIVSNISLNVADADVYTGIFPNMQLRGKIKGLKLDAENILYVQAKDVAGEFSKVITMPSSPSKKWFVKKPKSKMLFVVDYNQPDQPTAVSIFRTIIEDALPGKSYSNFDVLDIGFGMTADEKQNQLTLQKYGVFVPKNMNPQLIQTLKLFDIVFWYSDLYPSYLPAQIGLYHYTQTGGKVIFSTTFPSFISFADVRALNDFAPIDSVTTDANSSTNLHTNADLRIPRGTKVLSLNNTYPQLAFDSTSTIHNFNWRRVYKRTDSEYIYALDSSKNYYTNGTFRYSGTPEIGCIDNSKRFVLIALPLHKMNGNKNLPAFFKHIVEDEFQLN
ncbi:MAG: hypothetical protein Q8L88_13640 [Bacteroidota bacterium]|nr:hypothetical protein [Bacteroidota bacterium]